MTFRFNLRSSVILAGCFVQAITAALVSACGVDGTNLAPPTHTPTLTYRLKL